MPEREPEREPERDIELDPAVRQLLTELRGRGAPERHVDTLESVIERSGLDDRIREAVDRGDLRRLELLPRESTVEGGYQASSRTIYVQRMNLNEQRAAHAAFVLGHEVQHAHNREAMDEAEKKFRRDARAAAESDHDHTQAISDVLETHNRDEATANLSGWNAYTHYLRDGDASPTLDELATNTEASTDFFQPDHPDGHVLRDELNFDDRLRLDLDDERNVQAMADSYFYEKGPGRGPGAHGTSRNADYYGAEYLGQAARIEREVNSGEPGSPEAPMRVDLTELHLDAEGVRQNGVDLGEVPGGPTPPPMPYLDTSTDPPTPGEFTHGTDAQAAPSGHGPQVPETVRVSHPQPASAAVEQKPATGRADRAEGAGRIGRTGAARPPERGKPGIDRSGR